MADKHRLHRVWSMYYEISMPASTRSTAADWKNAVQRITDFDTVEDFWSLFNSMVPPSGLQSNRSYYMFKSGIFPAWEDKENKFGGRWMIQLPLFKKDVIDTAWLYIILGCIGEAFGEEANDICGVVVNARPSNYRVSLWTKTAKDESTQMKIGRTLKKLLESNESLSYSSHHKERVRASYSV